MRILVTGHKGYIGTVLVPALIAAGHDVSGCDSDLFAGCTVLDGIAAVPDRAKDIRDLEAEDLDGFEVVIHLAGLSNDPLGDLDPALTFAINRDASARLAEIARRAGIRRFVFSSSCSVYGASGEAVVDEGRAPHPLTPYGLSKLEAERAIACLATPRFTPVFLRSATAYGASPRLRFDLVLNNLVAWAFTTGCVYLKSDGTPWRPLVHVEDIADAILAVIEAPREAVHNQVFNVGGTGENYRMRALAEIVAAVVPGCRIAFAAEAGPDRRCYRVNCDKLRRSCARFRPRWTARTGAEELYRACRQAGLAQGDFEGPRFSRIAHLKQLLASGRIDAGLRWQVPAVA